jgi:6-phosphofructokinase 1
LIPEIPYDMRKVALKVQERYARRRNFAIVVVAEGATPKGGTVSVLSKELGRAERLGGAGERVAEEPQQLTGCETRCVVFGHLLRGGSPTTFEPLVSL